MPLALNLGHRDRLAIARAGEVPIEVCFLGRKGSNQVRVAVTAPADYRIWRPEAPGEAPPPFAPRLTGPSARAALATLEGVIALLDRSEGATRADTDRIDRARGVVAHLARELARRTPA